jgi:hypothetical protein
MEEMIDNGEIMTDTIKKLTGMVRNSEMTVTTKGHLLVQDLRMRGSGLLVEATQIHT